MAPRDIPVEQQTLAIISCLFDDDTEGARFRHRPHQDSDLETDGAGGGDDDDFDPVPLAEKLREVADLMMTNPRFQDVKRELLSATADHVVREVFSKNVEALWRAQSAEVSPEIQMTRMALALGLYLKDNLPKLKTKVQNTLNSYLQQIDGDAFARQGGWDAVANPCRPQ